jgi:hypothetical protein
MNQTMEHFWMVYVNGTNTHAPIIKQSSEQCARIETERLAKLNPGIQVYYLESKGCCIKRDVDWLEPDEIPF